MKSVHDCLKDSQFFETRHQSQKLVIFTNESQKFKTKFKWTISQIDVHFYSYFDRKKVHFN